MAELLLAIAILAVGIVSLVVVQAYAARARSVNNAHLLASQVAESELARVQGLTFDTVVSQPQTAVQHDMFVTVDVEEGWQGSPNLKGVTVVVDYPSRHQEKGGRVKVWSLVRKDNE